MSSCLTSLFLLLTRLSALFSARLISLPDFLDWNSVNRLCLAVIVALPAATPSELKNTASFALGGFTNCTHPLLFHSFTHLTDFPSVVNGWPDGYAFILSFLAPLWTICTLFSLYLDDF